MHFLLFHEIISYLKPYSCLKDKNDAKFAKIMSTRWEYLKAYNLKQIIIKYVNKVETSLFLENYYY